MSCPPISESSGHVFFETVKCAMNELGININDADNQAMLVWFDTIKDIDYFTQLMPWQIVNRIPNINVICRKASFVRCIQRISVFFKGVFTFLPKSFILPLHNVQFTKALQKVPNNKTYIVKSDGGALGQGIVIVHPGESYEPNLHLSIAQEYIESYLLNGYKFDLRVYVLVIATKIPKIYVYRDGIARFCSSPANENTPFSQLTNTAVNRKNPNACITNITRTIKNVFAEIQKTDHNFNITKMWDDIDEAIGLTVISSTGIVNSGVNNKISQSGLPYRSFQLLGFDVLISQNLKPYILEVNYRPSLESDSEIEKKLKVKMLKDLMSISILPFNEIECLLRSKNSKSSSKISQISSTKSIPKSSLNKNPSSSKFYSIDSLSSNSAASLAIETKKCNWSSMTFNKFLNKNENLLLNAKSKRKTALMNNDFVKIFPTKDPSRVELWNEILRASEELPSEIGSGYQLPRVAESLQCIQQENQKDEKEQRQQKHLLQQQRKLLSILPPRKFGLNPTSISFKNGLIDKKNILSNQERISRLPYLKKNPTFPT